jgi:pimeloyl-ACP methyl ester carboxylesterase
MLNYPPNGFGTILSADAPQRPRGGTLIVVIHGILSSHDRLGGLVERLKVEEVADVFVPHMPVAGFRGAWSFVAPETIIDGLVEDIDQIWSQGGYDDLKIIGFSLGGLYARAVLLAGIERGSDWAKEPDNLRLVLLAGINRGAGFTRQIPPLMMFLSWLNMLLLQFVAMLLPNHPPNMISALRGSDFITNLRLKWLDVEANHKLPRIVQLLGSRDDVVGPNDSLDLVTGRRFHYIDVPNTTHFSIIDVDPSDPEEEASVVQNRWRLIKLATFGTVGAIEKEEVRPWELAQGAGVEDASDDIQVVFVIHGIRDDGYWTDKIARRIWRTEDKDKRSKLRKVVDSYGYFGMGPFLLTLVRRRKVQWFMERYLEQRAQYPNARFHFVGHSHGTYVLAKALELYPSCRFDKVVFAGSIVRSGYQWDDRIAKGQVSQVLNFVATDDWVVAFFPRFYDLYNLQDLGGAGHVGFEQSTRDGPVFSIEYAIGEHGAGKQEALWDEISEFVLGKHLPELPPTLGQLSEQVTDAKSGLTTRRSSAKSLLIGNLSNLNFVIYGALIVILLAVFPALIINYAGPWVGGLISTGIGDASIHKIGPSFALIGVALWLFLMHSQKTYERKQAGLRTACGLGIVAGIFGFAAFVIQWSLSGSAMAGEQTVAIATTAVMTGIWLLIVIWGLRKI